MNDLKAINTKITDLLGSSATSLISRLFIIAPEFLLARENLSSLQKRVLALLTIFTHNKEAVFIRIPSIILARDRETLLQIARCFVAGIELSNDAMRELADLYDKSDTTLKSAIMSLHLRSSNYLTLSDYLAIEHNIKKEERRDCALAAFLSYDGPKNLELHKTIIAELEVEKGRPLYIEDGNFHRKN